MTSSKNTKRALLASVLSVVLCNARRQYIRMVYGQRDEYGQPDSGRQPGD